MTTEVLSPTGLIKSSHYTGSLTDIDEPVDSSDGSWMTSNQTKFVFFETTYPAPSANLQTGANLQKVRVKVRRTGNNGNNTLNVACRLEENNVDLGQIGSIPLTDVVSQVMEFTFDASLLSNVDGTGVGFRVQTNPKGSPPDNSDIDSIEWVAELVEAAPSLELNLESS